MTWAVDGAAILRHLRFRYFDVIYIILFLNLQKFLIKLHITFRPYQNRCRGYQGVLTGNVRAKGLRAAE
jgi:hypothetical protein